MIRFFVFMVVLLCHTGYGKEYSKKILRRKGQSSYKSLQLGLNILWIGDILLPKKAGKPAQLRGQKVCPTD